MKFYVNNLTLLKAQTVPGGLDRLLASIYRHLWNLFGLPFIISEVDLAVDVAGSPAVMEDIRQSQHLGHYAISGAFARHRVFVFPNSRRTDINGVNCGHRTSRVWATIYDRDVMLQNSKIEDAPRLRKQKRFLAEHLYDGPIKKGQHVIRTEFKLRDLFVLGPTRDSSRPSLDHPSLVPSKAVWKHSRSYCRTYWNQLDHNGLVSNLLREWAIFKSDLSGFKIRRHYRASDQSMTRDTIRKIRDTDPDRFQKMIHPIQKLLLRNFS